MALARRVRVPACGSRDHAIVGARELYLCHDCLKQPRSNPALFCAHAAAVRQMVPGHVLLTQSRTRSRHWSWRASWVCGPTRRHDAPQADVGDVRARGEPQARRRVERTMPLGGEKRAGWRQTWAFGAQRPFRVAVETSERAAAARCCSVKVTTAPDRVDGEGASGPRRASSRTGSAASGRDKAGCTHAPVVAAQHGHSEKLPCFRW